MQNTVDSAPLLSTPGTDPYVGWGVNIKCYAQVIFRKVTVIPVKKKDLIGKEILISKTIYNFISFQTRAI
jgi:hypothetical protein